MKQEISDRFDRNIDRVRNLLSIYRNNLSGSGRGRRGHDKTDVLRAAVVLLHAAMEDALRSLAHWKLPNAAIPVLDEIPLKGARTSKFTLGALASFRGKTVDQVITESTDASLERSNYNNPQEVAGLLQSLGVATATLTPFMTTLEATCNRRHKIVHRADENPNHGRGNYRVEPISANTVDEWISNTNGLVKAILALF